MKRGQRIAVVGAGTAGLASAIALADQGHTVTVFERFEHPQPVGAGLLLQPSGMAALSRLDPTLAASVAAVGARIDALDGRSPDGRQIMAVRYRDLEPDLYAVGLHRGQLFQKLLHAAVENGVELRTGFTAERVVWDKDARPMLARQQQCSGAFDALVVADGTQSALRAQLLASARCRPYPWGALWAIRPATADSPSNRLAQCYQGAHVMIGLLPTGRHPTDDEPCVSFFWSIPLADVERWRDQPFQLWQQRVMDLWPASESVVSALSRDDLSVARYGDITARHWHNGRSVVIGDAGHGMSPQLGQGANLALVDAVVLADCVREATCFAQAFANYSKRRRRHLRFYQRASRWLTPLFQSHHRSGAWLRDHGFPVARKIPWAYRETLRCVAGMKTGAILDKDLRLPRA